MANDPNNSFLEERLELLEEIEKIQEEIQKSLLSENQIREQIKEKIQDSGDMMSSAINEHVRINTEYKKSIKFLEDKNKKIKHIIKNSTEETSELDEQSVLLEEMIRQLKERIDLEEEIVKKLKEQQNYVKKYNSVLEFSSLALQKLTKTSGGFGRINTELGKAIGKKTLPIMTKLVGETKALSFASEMSQGSMLKALGALGPYGVAIGAVLQITTALVKKSFEVNKQIDEQTVLLNRNLGVTDDYNKELVQLGRNYLGFGLDMENSGRIINELANTVREFRLQTKESRVEMGAFVGQLELAGVSANVSSRIIQELNKTLKVSTIAAMSAESEIVSFARQAKLTPSEVAQGLASALPRIVQYGNRTIKTFKEMELTASNLGITTDTILNIADGVDTYAEAAETAGRVNALLGGGILNSTELMVNALEDPVKLIKIFREQLQSTGIDFQNLNAASKKAIASALPMDLATSLKLLSSSNEEFYKMQNSLEAQKLTQSEINRLASDAQTIYKKLELLAQKFAIALEPVVDSLSDVLDYFIRDDTKAIVPNQNMPRYAKGTDRAKGGLAIVGENGPEIVALPQNSSVINNRNVNKIVNNTVNTETSNDKRVVERQPVIITLDGRVISETVIEHIEDQIKLNRVY